MGFEYTIIKTDEFLEIDSHNLRDISIGDGSARGMRTSRRFRFLDLSVESELK